MKENNKMKKLMIAAAIVSAAVVSQAAGFIWGSAGGEWYDKDGTDLTLGTPKAFLYLGSVSASDTKFDLSAATFLASAAFDSDNWVFGNIDNKALTYSDALPSTASGQAYSIVLVNQDVSSLDGFEGNYTILAGESIERALPGATVSYYAEMLNNDAPITLSSTMAAPEPTSGLLILIGMAGLALRRRRA